MLKSLTSVGKALDIVKSKLKKVEDVEIVEVLESYGRVVARDYIALFDLPLFDRSAVDGYAVRAGDTYGASESNRIPLKVVGECNFENWMNISLDKGQAAYISTGVPIPRGANAVVMLEDVDVEDTLIYVRRPVPPYANISKAGEDFRKGDVLLEKGRIVRSVHIAALLAYGYVDIEVYRRLRVCLLAIGDELVEASKGVDALNIYRRGKTINTTSRLIQSYLSRFRFVEMKYLGIVEDDVDQIAKMLNENISSCDILLTTGGTGVSKHDVVVKAVERIGGDVVVRGLAIRPGRPTSIAFVENTPIFMLSGFPVAAFVALHAIVLPALRYCLGIVDELVPVVKARLTHRVFNVVGYRSYVRGKLGFCNEGIELCVEPIMLKGSGILSSLLRGNAFIIIPEDVEGFETGDVVDVVVFHEF